MLLRCCGNASKKYTMAVGKNSYEHLEVFVQKVGFLIRDNIFLVFMQSTKASSPAQNCMQMSVGEIPWPWHKGNHQCDPHIEAEGVPFSCQEHLD